MSIPSTRNIFGAIISLIFLENQLIIHQNEGENESNSFLIVTPSLYVHTLRNRAINALVSRPTGGGGYHYDRSMPGCITTPLSQQAPCWANRDCHTLYMGQLWLAWAMGFPMLYHSPTATHIHACYHVVFYGTTIYSIQKRHHVTSKQNVYMWSTLCSSSCTAGDIMKSKGSTVVWLQFVQFIHSVSLVDLAV
jgi:hypothetical protein